MSTAAERAREKAQRVSAAGAAAAHQRETETEVVRAPKVAQKPVRTTLDLAPAIYRELEDWTTAAARQIGTHRLNRSDVQRVMIRRLLDDEAFSAEVVEALRADARR